MPSPEHDAVVASLLAALHDGPTPQLSLQEQRAAYDAMGGAYPLADDVVAEPFEANGVGGEWVQTEGCDPRVVVLYLHGGGYVTGSIRSHRELVSRLARAAGARACNVDYRLAPEHPFPAALDDALTVYRWLLDTGTEPSRVVFGGDSAGGGLALSLALAARDAQLPPPAGIAMIAPWVDLSLSEDELARRSARDPLYAEGRVNAITEMARHYIASADPRCPGISPQFGDLKGLPPTLVQVGTADHMYEAATSLVDGLEASGVSVKLDEYERCVHVFQQLVPSSPEAAEAVSRFGDFVRERAG